MSTTSMGAPNEKSKRLALWRLLQAYLECNADFASSAQEHGVTRDALWALGDTADLVEADRETEFWRDILRVEKKHSRKITADDSARLLSVAWEDKS